MLTNWIRHLGVGMLVPSLIFKTSRFMHWGGSHVPVGIVQFIIVFALKLSSSLLQYYFNPLCCLSPFYLSHVAISRPCCLSRFYPGRASLESLARSWTELCYWYGIYWIKMQIMSPYCKMSQMAESRWQVRLYSQASPSFVFSLL